MHTVAKLQGILCRAKNLASVPIIIIMVNNTTKRLKELNEHPNIVATWFKKFSSSDLGIENHSYIRIIQSVVDHINVRMESTDLICV